MTCFELFICFIYVQNSARTWHRSLATPHWDCKWKQGVRVQMLIARSCGPPFLVVLAETITRTTNNTHKALTRCHHKSQRVRGEQDAHCTQLL
jgi:hypothetical protein